MLSVTSDDIEGFSDDVRKLDASLGKLGATQVIDATLTDRVSSLAKNWMAFSQHLSGHGIVDRSRLERYDAASAELFTATKAKTRASSFRKKLAPFVGTFYDEVVIPTIKHEGSPLQVAARSIQTTLSPHLKPDELTYIVEAVKCASMQCYRATVVLLWAAAIARFHSTVERLGFDAFNKAVAMLKAKSGHPYNKLTSVKIDSLAELQRMRDYDLLVVGLELWKYDLQVFQELERLLGIRNSAAHPGMYSPGALDIQQFTTKLDDHVFSVVPGP